MTSPKTAIPVVFGSMTIGKPGKFTFIGDFNIKMELNMSFIR
jgi:hypothetical protein